MNNYIVKSNVVFGSVSLDDYNAFAFYCNIFDSPQRDVDVVSIPGRNGDLVFDNGRYKNCDRIYQIQVTGVQNALDLVSALADQIGYNRLQDEYEDDVYMVARLKEPPKITHFIGDSTSVTLVFDRKPQKYLLLDEEGITGTGMNSIMAKRSYDPDNPSPGYTLCSVWEFIINNRTGRTARPYIAIPQMAGNAYAEAGRTPYCEITKWPSRVIVSDNMNLPQCTLYGYFRNSTSFRDLYIDCDERTFSATGTASMEDYIRLRSYSTDYPSITPGINYFYIAYISNSTTGQVVRTSPTIYPRWWKI